MRFLAGLMLCLVPLAPAAAQAPPSYAKQVGPFFTRYCVECHNATDAEGALNLQSHRSLMEGGGRGAAVVPGKPDASRLVRMIEGKLKPFMPPRKAKQPTKDEIALVRSWVLAGARDDSPAVAKIVLPPIAPKQKVMTPVTALAYEPGGKYLAAGGRAEVLLLDPTTGDVRSHLKAGRDRVTALAIAANGTLAVAASTAGVGHEARLWHPDGLPAGPGTLALRHDDVIQDLAFSPDGKILASAGYDRLIKLWDVQAGKLLRVLKDHSDSVYGLAFSPDGKLLASVAADRAVKVWDVTTGTRLYTLSEATDWLYAVAWSSDGKHLAAAGVDRSIRVWEVDRDGGRIVHSVFAHEGPVTRLIYSADGKTLYSLSEDRSLKAWDSARMVERKVYERQSETPLALALRPDQKQLALGRYDGALVLLDAETGKVQGQPLPVRPKPPVLTAIAPPEVVRGRTVEVRIHGKNLKGTTVETVPALGAGQVLEDGTAWPHGAETTALVRWTIPATAPPGRYALRLKNEAGESAAQTFFVDRFDTVHEAEPNDSPKTGQVVGVPASLVGAISRAGDLDWFRFEAKAGQEVGVEVLTAAVGSKLEPVLRLVDPAGVTVAESLSGILGHTCAQAGTYALGIRDREYRGGPGMHYRLYVGNIPVVTSVFPLGLQRGTESEITLEGVNLGKSRTVRLKAPATAAPGTRLPVPVTTPEGPPLGAPSVVVGEFPETSVGTKEVTLPVPGTANGRITSPGETGTLRFEARKGQRLLLEVNAARIGSPLDSTIEILDATGRPLPRATLRCLARTYVAFRDHDSRSPGIRLEAWSELAVNDYILVGEEVVRIRALPRNPDDDGQFFAEQGQRLGFFGTTPTHHSQGTPMYKVAVHPPGMAFPPNGLPVVTLFWRNDDGGPGFGKDSRLVFDPPADGVYKVRISDARGEGSAAHAYRLTVRPPRPDFNVSVSVAGTVSAGGAVPVRVNVQRIDELEGPIDVSFTNLPQGYSAPPTSIPAGESSTAFSLFAAPTAKPSGNAPPLELVATASVAGSKVVRKATAALPRPMPPGDIVTTTEQSEVTIRPGGEVRVTVKVQRRNGFTGRIPLEVQGLAHGVRVLDVGLNGILVIPGETTRTFVIHAEPWVEPGQRPFVVFARREGKPGEFAAPSVMLRVSRP
jgi:hypothetical protein